MPSAKPISPGRSSHAGPQGPAAMRVPNPRQGDSRPALGWRGQNIAIEHFRSRGFRLLTHNQTRRSGEIDLVVFDGHTLVFVEVKTRHIRRSSASSQAYGGQTLGWSSLKQFKAHRRTVRLWLAEQGEHAPKARDLRLDVVKVLIDEHEQLVSLDHIEAAWEGVW